VTAAGPEADGVDRPANLFGDLPGDLPEELIEPLVRAGAVRVERIVSRGHASPPGFWYDQPRPEWVVLLAGAARLRFEGEGPVELRPGDHLSIPAGRRHRVEWTTPDGPTVWLAVHYEA
jgi:cupin 2 domain-containing protein